MKSNPQFRYEVMHSTYFNPEGHETLSDVVHKWGEPVKIATIYMHMQRHQADDLLTARKKYKDVAAQDPGNPVFIAAAIEGEVESRAQHDLSLDAFIKAGNDKLIRGEMQISATNFLAAIKIKSDNEKSTKDRRADMAKAWFLGGKKNETTGN